MMRMISVARQFFLYLQVKVDAARQLAMQSSLVEYFRRFLTKPSNMWLEIRSKIHDRMHLDLEVVVIVLSLMTRFNAVLGTASLFL